MLGPIFTVDVVTSSRRLRYFLLRIGYAGLLLILFWINYQETFRFSGSGTIQQAARFAEAFFTSFSITQLCAVLLVGPALAAGTISVERERRTIEYLFATDLSNSEIVLGKLLARLLSTGMLLIVGLPILAIAALLGGINFEQLAGVFVITLSTMVAVATLGIAVSVTSPRVRDAIGRAYVLLLALLCLPAVIEGLLQWSGYFGELGYWNEWLMKGNPLVAFFKSLVVARMRGAGPTLWSSVGDLVLVQGSFSLVLAVFATASVRRVHLAALSRGPAKAKRFGWRTRAKRPVGNRPLLWKETVLDRGTARWGMVGRIALTLLAIAALLPFIIVWSEGGSADVTLGVTLFMGTVIECGGLLLVATRAAACVTTEREKDTWLMLLSTPMAASEFLLAKVWGNISAFRPVLFLLLLMWGAQALRTPWFVLVALWSLLTTLVLLLFVSTLGTMYSLQAKNSSRSLGATLATLLFMGGGYMFCILPCMFAIRDDSVFFFFAAGVVPMLLAVPGIAAEAWSHNQNGMGREASNFALTYLLGMLGYGGLAAALWAYCLAKFDALNGRVPDDGVVNYHAMRPHAPAEQRAMDAEVLRQEDGKL